MNGFTGPRRIAIELCRNHQFYEFAIMEVQPNYYVKNREAFAKQYLCDKCCIDSRKKLDDDKIAQRRLSALRERFFKWRLEQKARARKFAEGMQQ